MKDGQATALQPTSSNNSTKGLNDGLKVSSFLRLLSQTRCSLSEATVDFLNMLNLLCANQHLDDARYVSESLHTDFYMAYVSTSLYVYLLPLWELMNYDDGGRLTSPEQQWQS